MTSHFSKPSLLFLVSLLFLSIFSLQGCGKPVRPSVPPPKFDSNITVFLSKPKSETKIYVDGSLDEARNRQVMDFIAENLTDEKLKEKGYDEIELGNFRKTTGGQYSSVALTLVDTGEYHFYGCLLMCDEKPLKAHEIKRLDNGFYFEGFKTPHEVASLYKELIWYFFNRRDLDAKFGIHVPLHLAPEDIANGKALFTDSLLRRYTLKSSLEAELKKMGFLVVEKAAEADFVFVPENLGFGAQAYVENHLKAPVINKSYGLKNKNVGNLMYSALQGYAEHKVKSALIKTLAKNSSVRQRNLSAASFALGAISSIFGSKKGEKDYSDYIYTYNALSVHEVRLEGEKKLGQVIDKGSSGSLPENLIYKYIGDKPVQKVNQGAAKSMLSKIIFN